MNIILPNYPALKKNICYVIKEQHIKLGYTEDSVSGPWLYYPLNALNNMLGTAHDIDEMLDELAQFANFAEEDFGPMKVSNKAERFCFKLDARASKYVHTNVPNEPFLEELVGALAEHGTGIDDVLAIFRKYASDENDLVIEDSPSDEFDVLVYFGSGKPDPFIYCLADEMGHVTYHRLTRADLAERI